MMQLVDVGGTLYFQPHPGEDTKRVPLLPVCAYGLTHYGVEALPSSEDLEGIRTELNGKQDKLTAGDNIDISEEGGKVVISADLDGKQDKLTAGDNIEISEEGGEVIISASVPSVDAARMTRTHPSVTMPYNSGWTTYKVAAGAFQAYDDSAVREHCSASAQSADVVKIAQGQAQSAQLIVRNTDAHPFAYGYKAVSADSSVTSGGLTIVGTQTVSELGVYGLHCLYGHFKRILWGTAELTLQSGMAATLLAKFVGEWKNEFGDTIPNNLGGKPTVVVYIKPTDSGQTLLQTDLDALSGTEITFTLDFDHDSLWYAAEGLVL